MSVSLSENEEARLAALHGCHVLNTPPEAGYDDIVHLVASVCRAPIAAISLIDSECQWFKAVVGLDTHEMKRDIAFCAHTILQPDLMVIPDAESDQRFSNNPLVTEAPHVRFYAGAPLITEDGYALGALCILDRIPRHLTSDQEAVLRLLARQVTSQLESARRLAERERLIAEREQLAAIVESASDATWCTDLSGHITAWSLGAEQLYGCGAVEVIDCPQSVLFNAEESAFLAALQSLRRGEPRQKLEVKRRKDGKWISLSLTFAPIRDAKGTIVGVSACGRDITPQKQNEETLEKEREFTRALLENLSEGIVACDAQGNLTLINQATREFHGLPESCAEYEEMYEDLYEQDGFTPMQRPDVPLFRALRGEVVRNAEIVIAPKFGCARTLLASGQAIHSADGEKLGAVIALHDVTERRQAEQELSRLGAIVESSEEAILAATLDGIIVSWNRGAERLYGYTAAEMIGQYAAVLTGPGQQSPVPDVVVRLQRGEAVEPIEVVRRRKDGTEFQATLSFSPIRDAAGQIVGISCIARDITARKRAEEALAATHTALAKSEARLSEAQRVAQIGSWEYDLAEDRITWSEELFRLFGMLPAEGEPSAEVLLTYYHPDDLAMHKAVIDQAMCDGLAYEFDLRILRCDGTVRWTHAVGRGEQNAAGKVVRLFGTLMDIHERKLAEEQFRVLFEHSSDAQIFLDEHGIFDCNPAAVAILGCADKSQVLSLTPVALSLEFQPDGRRSDEKCVEMEALARAHGCHRFEWTHRRMNGETFPVEVALTPVTLADRSVLLAVWHDLTERKQAEEAIRDHAVVLEFQKGQIEAGAEMETLATTDGLTGLKNRRIFEERLTAEASRAARYSTPLSLILLDVDSFKSYNDTHGHPAGDAVLRAVSHVLQAGARETDLVARYGGEEFVLILPQTDLPGAAAFAERLREAVEYHPWPVRPVTASFGVATLCLTGEDGWGLVTRADEALYHSKTMGRNRVTCASDV